MELWKIYNRTLFTMIIEFLRIFNHSKSEITRCKLLSKMGRKTGSLAIGANSELAVSSHFSCIAAVDQFLYSLFGFNVDR